MLPFIGLLINTYWNRTRRGCGDDCSKDEEYKVFLELHYVVLKISKYLRRPKESFMRSSGIERVRDEFVSAKTSSGLSKELQTGAFILNLHLILHPFFKLYNPSEQLINRGTWRPLLPLGLTQKNTQRACVCLGSAHTERKRCVTNSRLASSGSGSNRERR